MQGSARMTTIAGSSWAAALPLLCAAHCAVSPLLVLVAPALALPESAEAGVKLASAALAAALLWRGMRAHGRVAPALPAALGLAVWAVVGAAGVHGAAERAWTVAGALLLAAGMAWSGRLRHRAVCRSCGCHAHAD